MNKLRGEKAPILEVHNPVCLDKRLYVWVHVHKHEHLIGYVEHVQLVDYDINNSTVFPGFSLKQYFHLMGDKTRILM